MEDHNHQMIHMNPDDCLSQRINCPDFHVLLDHTIAVLWMFYSDTPPTLNSAADTKSYDRLRDISTGQIQWAVRFLETIRNRDGERSVDVCTAIEHLQESVFNKYANAPTVDTVTATPAAELRVGDSSVKQSASLPNICNAADGRPAAGGPTTAGGSPVTLLADAAQTTEKMGSMAQALNDFLSRLCPEKFVHFLGCGDPSNRTSTTI